jgi:hypothetical protein
MLRISAGTMAARIAIWFAFHGASRRSRRSVDAVGARIDDIFRMRSACEQIQMMLAIDRTGAKAQPDVVERRLQAAVVTIGDEPGGKAAALSAGDGVAERSLAR